MRIALAAALLILAGRADAASFAASGRGTTSVDFLNFAVGARAAAMGGAYTAAADDAAAVYWNPAAMTRISHRSATAMHAAYLDSSFFDYAAYGQNFGDYGAAGAGVQYFSPGSISQTDAAGNTVGTVSPYDLAVTAAYAYKLPRFDFAPDLDGFSVGVGAKMIQSKIIASARTGAADIGILTPAYLTGRLRFAFTATNLGGTLVYGIARQSLPATLRGGAAFAPAPSWLFTAEAVMPANDVTHAAAGGEYWLPTGSEWKFAARAGFDSQTIGSVTGFTGATLGFGLRYRGTAIDYAFVPYGGVGNAHRLSLTYNF